MVDLGVLAAREGPLPFLARDMFKVRLIKACERAGLAMDGNASTMRAGRLSFAFLEAAPYQRWAVPPGADRQGGPGLRRGPPSWRASSSP